ncbi:MAG: type IX secretion system membrane protein PorP/SprF [Cytophagaceae bacterium]|nr:type IX secretion system membrane protein PorP/SprF [Cytophagaceae bacterium]MDW8456449.1 type IX secretion system membrane protein PorP/SprF [Cytophagaceae bacterium]
MRKTYFLFYVVTISALATAYAQQDPMFSQYMFNTLAVNPAYAGSRDVVSATSMYRKQWLRVDGAPRTVTFTADAPFNREHIGLGIIALSDKIGVTSNTGLYTCYAYRLRLEKGTLAMGLSAGFNQYKADYSSVKLSSAEDDYDPVFSQNINKTMPNFGAGTYYFTDNFYAGLSIPHIVNNKLFKKGDTIFTTAHLSRHVFLMGGYVFTLSSDVKLKPSVLVKYVQGSPINMDINANVWFFDHIAIGLSGRTSGALVSMLEVQATKQFRFGYAFDFTLNKIRKYSNGTHELMLRYEFGYIKNKILTPRYF